MLINADKLVVSTRIFLKDFTYKAQKTSVWKVAAAGLLAW
jgi:hypothetical protein